MPQDSAASPPALTLSDAEYHRLSRALLDHVEQVMDRWLDDDVLDVDTHRTGGLLELSLPGGSKIILNTQAPLHEIWMAARSGGYHYRHINGSWLNTRDGSEFFAALSEALSAQADKPLVIER